MHVVHGGGGDEKKEGVVATTMIYKTSCDSPF